MPILDFVGVDNYGHNVLFGFCLLNDSTESTMCWIFDNFQEIMEKEPYLIYSDQEPGTSYSQWN